MLISLFVSLSLQAAGGATPAAQPAGSQAQPAGSQAPTQWVVGAPAPEFVLPSIDGAATTRLSDLRGRAALVVLFTPASSASRVRLSLAAQRARELARAPADAPQPELGGDDAPVAFLAVARELHAERARLLVDWLGVPFPVLWDPFLTVAPEAEHLTALVDAAGVVRALDPDLGDTEALRALLLAANAPARGAGANSDAEALPIGEAYLAPALALVRIRHPAGSESEARAALSAVLWARGGPAEGRAALDAAVAALARRAAAPDARPIDALRAGALFWLRRNTPFASAGDGPNALAHWLRAATASPDDPVLTGPLRRLGPRLSKSEAPYAWIDRAIDELAERGEARRPLRVALTEAEVAGPSTELPRLAEQELAPDPEREVDIDARGLLRVEAVAIPNIALAAAPAHGAEEEPTARIVTLRVHVTLAPGDGARFDSGAPAPIAWLVVPQGWGIDRNLYTFEAAAGALGGNARSIDFELLAPEGVARGNVRGYVIGHVLDRDGQAVRVRRDLNFPCVTHPIPSGPRD
ncbi:MAG: hypothetical protein R3F49_11550 [Planctomycetota bacterium]